MGKSLTPSHLGWVPCMVPRPDSRDTISAPVRAGSPPGPCHPKESWGRGWAELKSISQTILCLCSVSSEITLPVSNVSPWSAGPICAGPHFRTLYQHFTSVCIFPETTGDGKMTFLWLKYGKVYCSLFCWALEKSKPPSICQKRSNPKHFMTLTPCTALSLPNLDSG